MIKSTKYIPIFLIIILLPQYLYSQVNLSWERVFSGSALGYIAFNYKVDTENNLIIAGEVNNGNSISEDRDFLLFKYSTNGELLWQKVYSSLPHESDFCSSLLLDSIDNSYMCGTRIKKFFPSQYKMVIMKHNSSGNLVWEKIISDSVLNFGCKNALINKNNDLIILSEQEDKISLTKMNLDGKVLKFYSHTQHAFEPVILKSDSHNNIYILGYANESQTAIIKFNSEFEFQWINIINPNTKYSYTECFLVNNEYVYSALSEDFIAKMNTVKYNSNGKLIALNQKFIGYPYAMKFDNYNNIIINSIGEDSVYKVWKQKVLKYDEDFNLIWGKQSDTIIGENETASDLQVDNNNNYLVSGICNVLVSPNIYRCYLISTVLDDDANELSKQVYSYLSPGSSQDLSIQIGENCYYLLKTFMDISYKYKIRILKYDYNNVSVSPNSEILSYYMLSNYPNPFNNQTQIKFSLPKTSYVKIILYDLLGKEMEVLLNENRRSGSYEIIYNNTKLASGVYFVKLHAGDFVKTIKIILSK